MGRGSTFYCTDCKVSADMGYGSYGTWLDGCRDVAEFDAQAKVRPDLGRFPKNQRVRWALVQHAGHRIGTTSEDWTENRGGRVYAIGSYGTSTNDLLIGSAEDGWQHLSEEEVNALIEREARGRVKCDGNHAEPRCADPECWQDDRTAEERKRDA